jgi:hypothetical protein
MMAGVRGERRSADVKHYGVQQWTQRLVADAIENELNAVERVQRLEEIAIRARARGLHADRRCEMNVVPCLRLIPTGDALVVGPTRMDFAHHSAFESHRVAKHCARIRVLRSRLGRRRLRSGTCDEEYIKT